MGACVFAGQMLDVRPVTYRFVPQTYGRNRSVARSPTTGRRRASSGIRRWRRCRGGLMRHGPTDFRTRFVDTEPNECYVL